METSTSAFGKVNWTDFKHVALHFLLSALISIALYALDQVVPQIDFGSHTAIAAPLVATAASWIKRYLTDYSASMK